MDLHEACSNGNEERIVEILCKAGENKASKLVRKRNASGQTPLHAACLGRQLHVVRLLLGYDVRVYFRTHSHDQIEKIAFARDSCAESNGITSAMVNFPDLIRKENFKAKIFVDDYGNTPLQCISCFGTGQSRQHDEDGFQIARILVERGDLLQAAKYKSKWTPLHWAAFNGHFDMTQLYLSKMAKPIAKTQDHEYAVDLAGSNGLSIHHKRYVQVLQLFVHHFLEHLLDTAEGSKYGHHLLYWSCAFGLKSQVRKLLTAIRLNPLERVCDQSSLHVAAEYGHTCIVQLLFEYTANYAIGWTCSNDHNTPLHLACMNRHNETVDTILKQLGNDACLYHELNDEGWSASVFSAKQMRPRQFEYAMVFAAEKRDFKEALVETLQEESSRASAMIVDESADAYLLITCSPEVLTTHARRIGIPLPKYGLLRSNERQIIIMDLIMKKINLQHHLASKQIRMIFPLHDAIGLNLIRASWFRSTTGRLVIQPLEKWFEFVFEGERYHYYALSRVYRYFGDRHALYFAWLSFLTVWLMGIAVPGLFAQVYPPFTPYYAFAVCLWTTLLVERWKRKRSELLMKWNVPEKQYTCAVRPEYYGDFELDPISKQVETHFPDRIRHFRSISGFIALILMAGLVVAVFVMVKRSQDYTWPFAPVLIQPYVTPTLYAISITVLNIMYQRIAYRLTLWENYRTESQYEAVLACKLFWFQFLNSFLALFWYAFVEIDHVRLEKQLITILIVRQVIENLRESVWPIISVSLRLKKQDNKSKVYPLHYQIQREEVMNRPETHIKNQIQTMMQFGYITMFITAFPAAPFVAVLTNLVQIRLEMYCFCFVYQRPLQSTPNVAGRTFQSILEFMSFAAVAVNCAMFVIAQDQPTANTILIAIGIEHIVLALKAFLAYLITDAPSWVLKKQAQVFQESDPTELLESHDQSEENHQENKKTMVRDQTETLDLFFDQIRDDLKHQTSQGDEKQVSMEQLQEMIQQQEKTIMHLETRCALAETKRYRKIKSCEICWARYESETSAVVKCVECKLRLCRSCDHHVHTIVTGHVRYDILKSERKFYENYRLRKVHKLLSSSDSVVDSESEQLKYQLGKLFTKYNQPSLLEQVDHIISRFDGPEEALLSFYQSLFKEEEEGIL